MHPQICTQLDRRLRRVYNQPGRAALVLDAHVLGAQALEEQEGAGALPFATATCPRLLFFLFSLFVCWFVWVCDGNGGGAGLCPVAGAVCRVPTGALSAPCAASAEDVQLMRVMERRFIIWTPRDLPSEQLRRVAGAGALNANQLATAAEAGQNRGQGGHERHGFSADDVSGGSPDAGSGAGSEGGGAWDRGLANIWREFCGRLEVRRGRSLRGRGGVGCVCVVVVVGGGFTRRWARHAARQRRAFP